MSEPALCVYCRQRPVTPACRPFCSERCRMADLGRWLGGDYRVAGPPAERDEPGERAPATDPDAS